MRDEITALVLTFNEAPNIERTLRQLAWVKNILVIDSFSTDGTVDLVKSVVPTARILQRRFDTFAAQCNFGLGHVATEWVLSLDADYVLTPELVAEIQTLEPMDDIAGCRAEFRYCIGGRPLRASVYPPRTILYRGISAKYRDDGHGHRVGLEGKIDNLRGKIDHDDRKPFSRWLAAQDRYSKIEARHLLAQPLKELSFRDRLRREVFFAPAAMFFYLTFGRGLILDGWRGWFYVAQRTIAEMLLSLRILIEERRLEAGAD